MKKKVILGLSGGVDSAVCIPLLLKKGYEVEAAFMRNWDSMMNNDILGNPNDFSDVCPQEKDYMDAQAVADHYGIKLHRVDFINEYWDHVFTYFLNEYKAGRTPNPDILCNSEIKFKCFLEYAESLGCDYIAMGHYARVDHEHGDILLKGVDSNKDQTYFLSKLTKKQISKALFPVGELEKPEVRRIALEENIPVAKKKDSTGICFIGERHFKEFLMNYLPAKSGDIITDKGKKIGTHDGLMYYTIGQRKGLNIGGLNGYENEPWFVIGKDLEKNILYVGQGENHPQLFSDSCILEEVNWLGDDFSGPYSLNAKFRYRQSDNPVTISWIDKEKKLMRVEYPQGVKAVTPGQACVFYDKDVCLGGGKIVEVFMNGIKRSY